MPFTCEEAYLQSQFAQAGSESLHLTLFPETPSDWTDTELAARWEKIFNVRRVVTGALEIERGEKRIGSSLEAAPEVYISDAALLKLVEAEDAADIFITSGATLKRADAPGGAFTLDDVEGVGVVPVLATGVKCARSWKYFDPATADPNYPDITARDAAAVKKLEAQV